MNIRPESSAECGGRRCRRTFESAVLAGAAAAVGALAVTLTVAAASAATGTFPFQLPTMDGPPDEDGVVHGSYELPNYQLDGSYAPMEFTGRPLLWIPEHGSGGITETRIVDIDNHSGWEQLNILGLVQIESFYSPLFVDDAVQATAPALINNFLFTPGGFTLFGLQYDSAHGVVNVLGPEAVQLFSVPFHLDAYASLDDIQADSAVATDVLEPGDPFGWL